jgi:D-glycerate 3-kinase
MHDVGLCKSVLSRLRGDLPLREGEEEVHIPFFDKSLNSGRGDRALAEQWQHVKLSPQDPLDVVLFEGWMLGFSPIRDIEVVEGAQVRVRQSDRASWSLAASGDRASLSEASREVWNRVVVENGWVQKEYLAPIESKLREWCESVYPLADAFVHLAPPFADLLGWVHDWRWQQEETMRARAAAATASASLPQTSNQSSRGPLSQDQVRDFVDRFMPMYIAHYRRLEAGGMPQVRFNLQLVIDKDRRVKLHSQTEARSSSSGSG